MGIWDSMTIQLLPSIVTCTYSQNRLSVLDEFFALILFFILEVTIDIEGKTTPAGVVPFIYCDTNNKQ